MIRADPSADQHGRADIADPLRRQGHRGTIEKALGGRRVGEQRLHLPLDRLVTRTGRADKRHAFTLGTRRRLVID